MFTDGLNHIQRKRAEFARDVEYIREMAADDVVDDITARAESLYLKEHLGFFCFFIHIIFHLLDCLLSINYDVRNNYYIHFDIPHS